VLRVKVLGVTEMVALPVIEPDVAESVVLPWVAVVARPKVFTLAIALLDDVHVTVEVIS
jgi:hypothetical protein